MAPRIPASRLVEVALLGLVLLLPSAPLSALPLDEGDLDPTFGGGFGIGMVPFDLGAFASDLATAVAETDGHRLIVAGSVTTGAAALPRAVAATRMSAAGAPDLTFGGGDARVDYTFGTSTWELVGMAVLPAGEILLAGSVQFSATDIDFLVLRLMPEGGLDPRFGGGDGWVSIFFDLNPGGENFDLATALTLTVSGDILVAGTTKRSAADWDLAVARLTGGGNLDTSFGGGTGKVVVPVDAGGYAGMDQATDVLIVPGGAIALVGTCENGGHDTTSAVVALLDAQGNLVPSFGAGGKAVFEFDALSGGRDQGLAGAVDGPGRLFVAGRVFLAATEETEAAIACLTPTGAPCGDFGATGAVHFPLSADPQEAESFTDVEVDDLGRLVACGRAFPAGTTSGDVAVARLLANGALDPSFAGGTGIRVVDLDHGPGSDDDEALDLALMGGKPVVVGASEYDGVDDDFFVLRLWVALVQADGFEDGTFSGWSSRTP